MCSASEEAPPPRVGPPLPLGKHYKMQMKHDYVASLVRASAVHSIRDYQGRQRLAFKL